MAFASKWCILDLLTLYHLFYTKTLYLLLKSLSTHPSHFIDQLHLIISYQKILNIKTMHFHSCFFSWKKNCGHFSTNMILVKYLHYYFCFSFYFWLPHLPPCFQCTFCHCNIHEKRSHLCLLMIVLQIYIVILSSNYQKIAKPFHGKSSKSNGSSCPFSLSVKTLTIFIIVFEKGKWSP